MNFSPQGLRSPRTLIALAGMAAFAAVCYIAFFLLAPSPRLSTDPFPSPIPKTDGAIVVDIAAFARLPVSGDPNLINPDGVPWRPHGTARMMMLMDEPGTCRLFVNDMRGPLYAISYDGKAMDTYIDLADPRWEIALDYNDGQRGFQGFAFHPHFNHPGPGFGKFYTLAETSDKEPEADFTPPSGSAEHDVMDTVLLEWTAQIPAAAAYDGGPPRELMRIQQPRIEHNGGQIGFNPLAGPADSDFGNLYISLGDSGGSGDPDNLAQALDYIHGAILRIDPLGSNSTNGRYGIPADNPFTGQSGKFGEIYAYGLRHPQRFGWDMQTGNLFVIDIGQDVVEEINIVEAGANYGWDRWEGSFRFHGIYLRDMAAWPVVLDNPRSEPGIAWPIVEFDHRDPMFVRERRTRAAITGVVAYRDDTIPELKGKLLFGEIVSGEVFYVAMDNAQNGGQDQIRRVLFNHEGEARTLLQLVNGSRKQQEMKETRRVDLRFGTGPDGQVFLLNKRDGEIRRLGSAPYSDCTNS